MGRLGLGNPQPERERDKGGGQESCCPALTSPLNFKAALPSGMLGRSGDLAVTPLLSAVCCSAATALLAGEGARRMTELPRQTLLFPGGWGLALGRLRLGISLRHPPIPEPHRRMAATGGRPEVHLVELRLSA